MKPLGNVVIGGVAAYLMAYLLLSSTGAYAPLVWGLNGVKWYGWAPTGFYDEASGDWRPLPFILFLPLNSLDNKFWHTHGLHPDNHDPKHPVVFPRRR